MNILVDKITNKVNDFDRLPTQLEFLIETDESVKEMSKLIKVQRGKKQKTNEKKEPLFKKEIFHTEYKENLLYKDETLEDTGEPIMEEVQKTNSKGELLYSEPIYKDDKIIDYVDVTNQFDENEKMLEPIKITVQKKSRKGKLLYWKKVTEQVACEVSDGFIETTEMTDEPVMLPNIVDKTVYLKYDPQCFDADDIISYKYQDILNDSDKVHLIADMIFSEDEINMSYEKHLANTGSAFVELLPKGELEFKPIPLESAAKEFELLDFGASKEVDFYVNDKKVVDKKVTLSKKTDTCIIKFVNTSDKKNIVRHYALAY